MYKNYWNGIILQGVSGEYQEAISATLSTLEQDLSHTLHNITLPPSLLDSTQKPSSPLNGASLQDTIQKASLLQGDDTQQDCSFSLQKDPSSNDPQNVPQDLTTKVEHLINVRTALVDAANGMCRRVCWMGKVVL